jgi:cytochrome c oxidase cbb3-type subunit III
MIRLCVLLLAIILVASCEREERDFRSEPAVQESEEKIALTTLSPGDTPPLQQHSGMAKAYESNAMHMSNGKRLFTQFNCSGCHGNGGGGSGPALMDDVWIYGSGIQNIVATIREGRPNGMPSFRGKIADEQIWEIAAFVRALGGFVPSDIAPSRNDALQAHESENRLPPPSEVKVSPAPPPVAPTQ